MAGDRGIRVFLDTNVVPSGLYSSRGAPAIILDRITGGEITVVISRRVLEEILRVVKEKLPRVLPALRELLEHRPPEIFPDAAPLDTDGWSEQLQEADAAILAAAVNAKPDYFVTGDRHFLDDPVLAKKAGPLIVSPSRLLMELDG